MWTATFNRIDEINGDLQLDVTLTDVDRSVDYPWSNRYPRDQVQALSNAELEALIVGDITNYVRELDSAASRIDHLKTNHEGETIELEL